jgi:acyl-[acyl-carrier-protein]-phospholipid O-acyltransferase/long-chain-fatty-acid--[acyl-carrier-protein] ligase
MKEKKNPWLPLFLTNFLAVLNDNVIKYLVIFVGVYWVSEETQNYVISIASAMLVIPFILFSPLAGRYAKIYEKKKIMVWGKFAEIPIMLVAITGFYFKSLPIVMTAVLLMGLQSTMFSPAKYGLIRDIRGKEGISFGTGMMEMLTFVGVLLGTMLAGVLGDYLLKDYNILLLSVILLSVAFLGWIWPN